MLRRRFRQPSLQPDTGVQRHTEGSSTLDNFLLPESRFRFSWLQFESKVTIQEGLGEVERTHKRRRPGPVVQLSLAASR
ncbi:hypothetical protein WJX84_011981 [Apatococcus fuscideae]|uniref:Uncharacterized protein n=1 Tax=Apatococcus fuscideae TaxID=2026836 RepID=A0AAW1TH68_9CHLO